MSLTSLLLGRRLANQQAEGRKIGALEGVPAMGLDGLGSASYGPEAMLAVLAVAGSASLGAILPITLVILVLLAVLFVSYWQTIAAYPGNGGCYTVARENLGEQAGLLAAAALMVDYMLNVAVGISAGVGALTSAIPALHALTLPLCLGILVVLTLVNLRGTKESGLALAVPTYLFIASLVLVLAHGLWVVWHGDGAPHPVVAPPSGTGTAGAVTTWLVLRAFAAGCTAMTGVEAVSNGVSVFKSPAVLHAHRTLAAICAVLGVLLLGIGFLAHSYGVTAMDQSQPGYQSVVSQLIGASWGRGWVYDVTIGSVLAVLCLSANTSFVGFPRLCRQVARDGYLPGIFALPGRRLVYTAGVLFLAVGAGGLLIGFGGITDRLIPLFAVGAFLSFTLSQAGMAAHWRTQGAGRADRTRLWINGLGAAASAAALAIILLAKFAEGAWLTVIAIPLALLALRLTRRYYDALDSQLLRGADRPLDPRDGDEPPLVILPIGRWDRISQTALGVAMRLSPEVTAIHCTDLDGPEAEQDGDRVRGEWHRCVETPLAGTGRPVPRLLVVPSPYRSMLAPLLRAVQELRRTHPDRAIAVVLPQLVEAHGWETLLHTHRERRLTRALQRQGGPNLVTVAVPWNLGTPRPEQVMAEEEPQFA